MAANVTPVSAIYNALNSKRPPTKSTQQNTSSKKPGGGFAEILEEARQKLV